MRMKDSTAVGLLAIIVIASILVMWIIGIILARPAHAEWVSIDRFQGLITHESSENIPIEAARYVDGWQVRNGGLERPWFTKWTPSVVTGNPTYILGHSGTGDALLYFSSALGRLKADTMRNVGFTPAAAGDSGIVITGTDSILTANRHVQTQVKDSLNSIGRYWLNYVLTDRSSLYYDGADVDIQDFYSNRWALATAALTVDTALPFGLPLSIPSVDEGAGTLDYIDTTLILDGSYSWIYEGALDTIRTANSTTVTSPPVFQAASSDAAHYYDTTRVLNVSEYDATDSMLVFSVNPDDSLRGGDYTRFWILWDDTLSSSAAKPCSVVVADTTYPDSVRLTILADSTLYKNVNHYWGRVEGSGNPWMYCILYRPGTPVDVTPHNISANNSGIKCSDIESGSSAAAPRARFAYSGYFGGLHYGVLEVASNDNYLAFTSELIAKKARITDADVFDVTSIGSDGSGNYYLKQDTISATCIAYKPDTAGWDHWWRFVVFDIDTIKKSQFDSASASGSRVGNPYADKIEFRNRPRVSGWSVTSTNASTSPYRFAALHRQRAWSAGNNHEDSAAYVYYSNQMARASGAGWKFGFNQFNVAGNILPFEGADRVTGLSSFGASLGIYFRRKIMINSGFSATDWYAQPAPVGIGAVNHWSIARSRRHNQDVLTNENGIFFFNGSGLEPLTDQITEVFSDSVNWDAEAKLRAAVWDNMYFVALPTATSTSNTKVVGLDLETRDAWIASKPRPASVWNWPRRDGAEELMIGDADSSVIWQMNGDHDDLYYMSEWKSGWTDLGDASTRKAIVAHQVEYVVADTLDTLIIDWYTDLVDTVVWSDVITGQPAGTNTYLSQVSRIVQGDFLSCGIRSPDSAVAVNRFSFDWKSLGGKRR